MGSTSVALQSFGTDSCACSLKGDSMDSRFTRGPGSAGFLNARHAVLFFAVLAFSAATSPSTQTRAPLTDGQIASVDSFVETEMARARSQRRRRHLQPAGTFYWQGLRACKRRRLGRTGKTRDDLSIGLGGQAVRVGSNHDACRARPRLARRQHRQVLSRSARELEADTHQESAFAYVGPGKNTNPPRG